MAETKTQYLILTGFLDDIEIIGVDSNNIYNIKEFTISVNGFSTTFTEAEEGSKPNNYKEPLENSITVFKDDVNVNLKYYYSINNKIYFEECYWDANYGQDKFRIKTTEEYKNAQEKNGIYMPMTLTIRTKNNDQLISTNTTINIIGNNNTGGGSGSNSDRLEIDELGYIGL